jgi:hypothetical protein
LGESYSGIHALADFIRDITKYQQSAKKFDGEESRTILLNGNKVIPSNCKPNISEVFVHNYFDEEFRIEGSGVDETSVLENGVALSFMIIA